MSSPATRRARGQCTAFDGPRRLAQGPLAEVVAAAKFTFDRSPRASLLIFEDATGDLIDVDYSGTPDEVLALMTARELRRARIADDADAAPRGPGRPRLGVVAREVTLLPRHWQWLNGQPGGASVALRKLVDEARKLHAGRDRVRRAQEVSYRFMSALAGDLPGFEDAIRALFTGDPARFDEHTRAWPRDVRTYARQLAAPALGER
ncbi:MAG: DUF2239 family protein [Acidobacteria bacterium]|nr:DUF2239 family protein [Acidobacteriota bacterium]